MKHRVANTFTILAVPLIVSLAGCAHLQRQAVVSMDDQSIASSFDNGSIDGWTMVGGEVLWKPTEGGTGVGTGGYARGFCASDGTTAYYVAPEKFHCDWTQFVTLRVRLSSSGGKDYNSGHGMRGDIYLANGQLTAQRLFDRRPAVEWTTFEIPLMDDGNWTLGGGAKALTDVLCNVTNFQIRAEYGDGEDKSSLGNVQLIRRK